jgi:hypothetical protein
LQRQQSIYKVPVHVQKSNPHHLVVDQHQAIAVLRK